MQKLVAAIENSGKPRHYRELRPHVRQETLALRLTHFAGSLRAFSLEVACHERTLRFAEGKRKVSRMLEAAGVEL
jgi:hypothetical protein